MTSIKIGWDNNKRFHKSVGANDKGFKAFKLRVYKNNDNKYFIEKVSDDENNNSSIHYQVEVDAVIEKENDPNKLSFDDLVYIMKLEYDIDKNELRKQIDKRS